MPVIENVWKRVQSLVKLRLMLVSWSFESGRAEVEVATIQVESCAVKLEASWGEGGASEIES